jgi:CHAD domain-containing protein
MPWTAVNLETVWIGLDKTLRRGKKALEAVEAGSNLMSLHELRKRAKDLRYHLTLLQQLWKEVIGGYSDSAKDLEQRLGDDHNLAIIRETVLGKPNAFGSKKDLRRLAELIDKRRRKLQREAIRVAALLYADKPGDWRSRLERTWGEAAN